MTVLQAAEAPGVSWLSLVMLLDEGWIPIRKVGTDRRVLFTDLMDSKQTLDQCRLKALDGLAAQKLKMHNPCREV